MSKVTLVGVTSPYTQDCNSTEQMIAYCARISNPQNMTNHQTASKLLKYLAKHKHWSPFQMVSMTLRISTTRDIARQILRHRSFSFQQFSQRYAVSTKFQTRQARLQDRKNRQNSLETQNKQLQAQWLRKQQQHITNSQQLYKWALDNNIAKQQARAVLPQGLTGSQLMMSGTVRSWIHYCQLRMSQQTQKQHRQVATQCWQVLMQQFPSIQGVL